MAEQLQAGTLPAAFLEEWGRFTHHFGCRGPLEMDVAHPRYADAPVVALRQIAAMVDDPDYAPAAASAGQVERRRAAAAEVIRRAGSLRRRLLLRLDRVVELFAGMRDTPKQHLLMILHGLRRRLESEGERLHRQGRIDAVEHVFDFSLDELVAAAEQLQQRHEHVDEIEIEAERAHDGAFGHRRRVIHHGVVAILDPLGIVGGEASEDQHADHGDGELQRVRPQEQVDDGRNDDADHAHDQEGAPSREVLLGRVPVQAERTEGPPPYPHFRTFRDMFAKWKASAVASTYSTVGGLWEFGARHDPEKPFESVALHMLEHNVTNRNYLQRYDQIKKYVEDWDADGVIIHFVKSCRLFSAGQGDMRDYFTRTLGVPTLYIESDLEDPRYFSEAQLKNRIDAYFEALEHQKVKADSPQRHEDTKRLHFQNAL